MAKPSKFSKEVKERAVRLVLEQRAEYGSQAEAIRSVSAKLGCNPETLRVWMRRAQIDAGERPGVTTDERTRMLALELFDPLFGPAIRSAHVHLGLPYEREDSRPWDTEATFAATRAAP